MRPTLESRCACVRSQGDMSGKNIKTRVMRTFECTNIALRSESRLFIVHSRDKSDKANHASFGSISTKSAGEPV